MLPEQTQALSEEVWLPQVIVRCPHEERGLSYIENPLEVASSAHIYRLALESKPRVARFEPCAYVGRAVR
jgi:hypothetical protein